MASEQSGSGTERLISEARNHIKDGQVAMNDGDEWMAGWHFALAMSCLHEYEGSVE